ncbi:MAG: hypothetical protein NZ553_10885 [Caldilinea sp.]|nr:hypothetical protein [Caldilinea sp.]MDW8440968.1 hypothetical protein [Caldilineaceae bacterium]
MRGDAIYPLTVAMAAIARPTFDVALAQSVADEALACMERSGLRVVGTGNSLIMDADGAARMQDALRSLECDLLVLLQASFADSSMAVTLAEIAALRRIPVLLWAAPEARTGGRLRLNSLCGVNLAGHALMLRRIPYDYVLAPPHDPTALTKMITLARAGRALRMLNGAVIGLVGEYPAGFDTCAYEADDLKALFGVRVERIALNEVLQESAAAPQPERERFLRRVAAVAANLHELDTTAVRGTAGVYAALRRRIEAGGLSGVAVRCWPEFFTELGCAACGAMSLLNDERCPTSCEADVNGTVTSLLLQALSGEPAFIADLVSIEASDDSGVLWHCGLAPVSMADPEAEVLGAIHSNRKLPLLFEFPLKPGRVTLARLHRRPTENFSTDASNGAKKSYAYALVIGSGEMLRAEKSFSGTSGVIRFDRPAIEVFDTIMRLGLEHHVSLTYGNHCEALRHAARVAGIPVVEML